jgi:hypothetical protein
MGALATRPYRKEEERRISCSSQLSHMTSNLHYELKFKYIQNLFKLFSTESYIIQESRDYLSCQAL